MGWVPLLPCVATDLIISFKIDVCCIFAITFVVIHSVVSGVLWYGFDVSATGAAKHLGPGSFLQKSFSFLRIFLESWIVKNKANLGHDTESKTDPIGRLQTPISQAFSCGIQHSLLFKLWLVVQWITMKVSRILYENACRTGICNHSNISRDTFC